jgi:hypothetical protein
MGAKTDGNPLDTRPMLVPTDLGNEVHVCLLECRHHLVRILLLPAEVQDLGFACGPASEESTSAHKVGSPICAHVHACQTKMCAASFCVCTRMYHLIVLKLQLILQIGHLVLKVSPATRSSALHFDQSPG